MIGLDRAVTVPAGPFGQHQCDLVYIRRKRFTLIGPHPLTVGAGAGVCVREPDDADAVVLLRRMAQPSRNRQAIALGVASDGIPSGEAHGEGTVLSPAPDELLPAQRRIPLGQIGQLPVCFQLISSPRPGCSPDPWSARGLYQPVDGRAD